MTTKELQKLKRSELIQMAKDRGYQCEEADPAYTKNVLIAEIESREPRKKVKVENEGDGYTIYEVYTNKDFRIYPTLELAQMFVNKHGKGYAIREQVDETINQEGDSNMEEEKVESQEEGSENASSESSDDSSDSSQEGSQDNA